MDKTKAPYNEIWLDFLCWESFISILFSDKISANAKIYYCQISKCYQPVMRVVQLLTKKSFIQIQDFVFSSERINNVSAYEMVHDKMEKLLNLLESQRIFYPAYFRACGFFAHNIAFNIGKKPGTNKR